MTRKRIHGEHSQVIKPHPVPRYADRIKLIQWRRGPSNPTWEAQVRLPDGSWTRPFSLGTDDEQVAVFNAADELAKRAQLQESGLPQPSRAPRATQKLPAQTFGEVAQAAIERLTAQRDETLGRDGSQKAHKHVQHIRRIRNVLMPAFADMPVRDISRSSLNDWMRQYRTPGGEPIRQNTVGNYNHSFQMVMALAVERGWIRSDDVPSISKRGFEQGRERPWFSRAEIEVLRDHMTDHWVAAAHKKISTEIRYLLRAYIALASCTGIRPGLEIERIRINQVLFERSGKASVIRIPILRDQAKHKNSRDVYVFENDVFDVRRLLTDLVKWQTDRAAGPATYLFSRPSDRKVPTYSQPFKILMNDTALLLDPETQRERVPYSLRHYFATEALLRGHADHIVAKWMGTSPQMIDQHYSKVKLRMKAAELAGTDDKLANIRARIRRDDAELKNEPIEQQDEYPPDEIVYGSYFTEGSR